MGTQWTPREWFTLCRSDPKLARRTVRKACESDEGRRVSLSQLSTPVQRMAASFSCPCGKVCRSKAAYAAHQASVHGKISPVRWFARADGLCEACGLCFSNRILLCNHLRAGSPLCLLSVLLRVPHFTDQEEKVEAETALEATRANQRQGNHASASSLPAYRRPWVPWKFFDLHSRHVPLDSPLHPCRVGRVQYGWT